MIIGCDGTNDNIDKSNSIIVKLEKSFKSSGAVDGVRTNFFRGVKPYNICGPIGKALKECQKCNIMELQTA